MNIKYFLLFICTITIHIFHSIQTTEFKSEEILPFTSDINGKKDITNDNEIPRNFRTMKDNINISPSDHPLRLDGLKDLAISGSSQFTENQLRKIIEKTKKKMMVVDLREETHLILENINGSQLPITAYAPLNVGNEGKTVPEIELDLERYKDHILEQGTVTLYQTKDSEVLMGEDSQKFSVEVANVYTEKEIIEKISENVPDDVSYKLIPLTDHKYPSVKAVDNFLNLLKDSKEDPERVILFHCQAGRGRTGLIMVMTDIVENAVKYDLSLEEILKRQELLGSPDFSKIKPGREDLSSERYDFLKHFYAFAIAQEGLVSGVSYSFWQKIHPMDANEKLIEDLNYSDL